MKLPIKGTLGAFYFGLRPQSKARTPDLIGERLRSLYWIAVAGGMKGFACMIVGNVRGLEGGPNVRA
jgi:hypothetical protein